MVRRLIAAAHLPALLAMLLLALTVGAAGAAATPTTASAWAVTEHGSVRLLAGTVGTGTSGETTAPLGLEFRLADGWKIYWRAPGDAGYPPAIDWTGSQNLADTTIAWPAPVRFSILGFETVGYEGAVILPIDARLQRAGEPLHLEASVDYLTCKEICVPYVVAVTLTVPAGPADASGHAAAIAAARAQVPGEPGGGDFSVETLTLTTAAAEVATLQAVARSENGFAAPDLFLEGPRELAFGAPAVRLSDGGRTAVLDVPVYGLADLERPLAGEHLTLTLRDGDYAVEQRLSVADAGVIAAPPAGPAAPSLLLMLAIAWLGGLILNLMPCVLPVLSIKLLGLAAHGGGERSAIRRGFLASAAGIVASFWVIAAALLAIDAAGGLVGWGLQFQQPWFLVSMTLIVALFVCNLLGWFEVPLPRAIADAGAAAGHVRGLGGQFLTGALATVLATPCTAPFVGTAIGFALAGDAVSVFGIFTAMGIGLATPYLAVAAVPALAQRLPRPGAWMVAVKRVLAVALLATGGWLLSVLAAHVGTAAAMGVGALTGLLIAGIALSARAAPAWRRAGPAVAVAAAVAAFAAPSLLPRQPSDPAATVAAGRWAPFEPERIPELVAAGKTVVVNVTADWCLTCKVNERAVLERPPVRERLAAADVVVMQADWTRPDDGISRYLASFGRYGIPFDAVYGPNLPQGEALPELLTSDVVISAIDRAAARRTVSVDGQAGGAAGTAARPLAR
jgi:suppressor for copper-sensitivity B